MSLLTLASDEPDLVKDGDRRRHVAVRVRVVVHVDPRLARDVEEPAVEAGVVAEEEPLLVPLPPRRAGHGPAEREQGAGVLHAEVLEVDVHEVARVVKVYHDVRS